MRKLSREARRKQLMDVTIEVVAARGYARTTLTEVAGRAGLSHGLANFHFKTKELLLSETLGYMSDEYRENWQQALLAAPPDPAHQIDALYQIKCGSNDAVYIQKLETLCGLLIAQGGYPGNPVRVARVIRVTSERVWRDLMTQGQPYSLEEGLYTVFCAVAAFFPRHFDTQGKISDRFAKG